MIAETERLLMIAETETHAAVARHPHADAFQLNVVLFSGGSGTGSIASTLLRHPQVSLTIVINAYDDGHSTGRLRRFIPGMLGPSDVRKNVNRMMLQTEERHRALLALSDHRLPKGYPFGAGMKLVKAVVEETAAGLPDWFQRHFELLGVKQARIFQRYFRRFLEYSEAQVDRGNFFNFDDCALGNILFAGCHLDVGRDFNRTVQAFSDFFEIQGRILNITRGENLFLMARTQSGTIIRGEAELVSRENTSPIRELFLVDEDIYRQHIEPAENLTDEEVGKWIQAGLRIPALNAEAERALETADIIIYGPGTQHSSLLPSYLTRGVAEAIAANQNADKVFISNIRRDVDIQQEDANELAKKFLNAMSRGGEFPVDCNRVVTNFFFQRAESYDSRGPSYVPFDESAFAFPLTNVTVRDWEAQEGKHAGGYVVQELTRIVQCRLGAALESSPDMVSIIVPTLNEEKTVADTLRRLTAMDFHNFGLGREVIFVDGGSTDRTLELARSVEGVRVYQSPAKGRGAALRFGVEKAHGDIVLFFPADLEYFEQDLYSIVFSIVKNNFKVVFGTRAVKCTDLSSQLSAVYNGRYLPYIISKYGGMLLSIVTLLLYNRYVSDTLTSIKGFDAEFLRSLDLRSNGMDLDTEIVAKVCRRRVYILEIPVEYTARTKAQGKKSTPLQGIKAVWSLISWRFAPLPSGRPVVLREGGINFNRA